MRTSGSVGTHYAAMGENEDTLLSHSYRNRTLDEPHVHASVSIDFLPFASALYSPTSDCRLLPQQSFLFASAGASGQAPVLPSPEAADGSCA